MGQITSEAGIIQFRVCAANPGRKCCVVKSVRAIHTPPDYVEQWYGMDKERTGVVSFATPPQARSTWPDVSRQNDLAPL